MRKEDDRGLMLYRHEEEELKQQWFAAYDNYFRVSRNLLTNLDCDERWSAYCRARDKYFIFRATSTYYDM